ncbi:hypothetical protein POVCU2_0042470 [Plasmodium ovale curtisi]|uniref:Uncharacterized protein n=1 Tax=Plasmodium ovale curtisi TaxID=864141 RepID=A0A1A8WYZ3_PLAOA|nr:hypothetical protein POVCU2_0042470 [Plasmodium ovale curtisi]SBS97568.1 hypothetical protein POVCU1_039210 [Plasmodium ovale curtisi]
MYRFCHNMTVSFCQRKGKSIFYNNFCEVDTQNWFSLDVKQLHERKEVFIRKTDDKKGYGKNNIFEICECRHVLTEEIPTFRRKRKQGLNGRNIMTHARSWGS